MDKAQARTEAERMANTLRAFKWAEEVLQTAFEAEAALPTLKNTREKLETELAAVQGDVALAKTQYEQQTKDYAAGLAALKQKYTEQEAAQQEKIEALKQQAALVESQRDAARRALQDEMHAAQAAAGRKREELEREYEGRKMQLRMEEDAVRSRLDSAKAELAALLKRVGG